MAEKLATRLSKVQVEIHEISAIFRRAQDISEDDLMDGEYYVDQLNKAVRKLNALSKKYEGCTTLPGSTQVNTTTTAVPSESSKEDEDVRISGQTGGSVDLDSVFNLCFRLTNSFEFISFMKMRN